MIKWTAAALILGFLIDLLLGDPRWLYHPVRIIGNSISLLEKMAAESISCHKTGGTKSRAGTGNADLCGQWSDTAFAFMCRI